MGIRLVQRSSQITSIILPLTWRHAPTELRIGPDHRPPCFGNVCQSRCLCPGKISEPHSSIIRNFSPHVVVIILPPESPQGYSEPAIKHAPDLHPSHCW